jgi:DNA polymerase I-like protein with 3'-5' exonuclease and polymerase domains
LIGGGAEYVGGKLYEYLKKHPEVPVVAQIHDELLFEAPKSWDDLTILKFCDILTKESQRLPGFSCPWSVKVGNSWGDLREIKKNFTGI